MSFFEKIDLDKKLNIFTGNFFQHINDLPSRFVVSEMLMTKFNFKNFNKIENKSSLFDVSQCFVDEVIGTKSELLEKINEIYDYKKEVPLFLEAMINSGIVSSIINTSYDSFLDSNSSISKITPYDFSKMPDGKIRYYKVFGDISFRDKCAITRQDFRKLKILPFYTTYWESIRYELQLRSSIFIGVDFNDSDFFEFLDFIFGKELPNVKPMYFITSKAIFNPKVMDFFNKNNIKILVSSEYNFFKELNIYLGENSKINLNDLFPLDVSNIVLEKKTIS